MIEEHKRYAKPKVKCPYCDRILSQNGLTLHVDRKHPEHNDEFQANKDTLIQKFRVDKEGASQTDSTTPTTLYRQDEVISETPPATPEPIVEEVPTPPTPTPPTPPPIKKPDPIDLKHEQFHDDPEEPPKPKGFVYDPYGFCK
ncbi:hypothetical protein KAU11_07905 [Candidatus Babeliales bacterium]|nr:hypothetical protein [Candidatus Babeliales bacterium]